MIKRAIQNFFDTQYQPIKEALQAKRVSTAKRLARHLLWVFVPAILVIIFTRDPVILGFAIVYFCGCVRLYFLHKNMQGRFSRRDCTHYVIVYFITTGAYSSNVVYLISYGTLEMISLCLLAGLVQAMYNFTRYQTFNILSIWETSIITLQAAVCGVFYIGMLENPTEITIVIICAAGVSGFYVLTQIKSILSHTALNKAKAEMVQMQKMRAIGQLTAGVAHDFNNILSVIKGNLELSRIARSYEELEEYLNDAEQASDQAAAVIAQLMAFSRKAPLKAATVSVAQFVDEFERVLVRVLPKSIALEITHDPALKELYCDMRLLQNTILNLVINARDAMKGMGEIAIHFKLADVAKCKARGFQPKANRQYGHITIKDNGPGIPAKYLENVTEPFFTTKDKGKGSGLGLSTAKGFAEQSDGHLYVRSPEGEGTTVGMFIPVKPHDFKLDRTRFY